MVRSLGWCLSPDYGPPLTFARHQREKTSWVLFSSTIEPTWMTSEPISFHLFFSEELIQKPSISQEDSNPKSTASEKAPSLASRRLEHDYIFCVASVAPLCCCCYCCCRLRVQSLGTRARNPSLIVSCQSEAFPRSSLPQTPSVFPPLEPREMPVCHIRLSILEWMTVPCLQVNHPA